MIKKYVKKPVTVEAIQWIGDNVQEIFDFTGEGTSYITWDSSKKEFNKLWIKTLESDHHAKVGDYIIKDIKGECYPCKPDIFAQTYEEVKE